MDKMLIESKLMRGLIERWLKKAIRRKIGCDVVIRLNRIMAENDGKTIKLHIDGDAEMASTDLDKFISGIV